MRIKSLLSAFVLMFPLCLMAQRRELSSPARLQWGVSAGLNIGATAPLPVPSAVTKIHAWYPNLNPSAKLWSLYSLDKAWALSFAIEAQRKSFSATSELKELSMSFPGSDAVGIFSGNQNVSISNTYLTLPVGISYSLLQNRLQFRLEGYASLLMSADFKVKLDGDGTINGLPLAPDEILYFDFEDQIRRYDLGLRFGAKYYFTQRIGAEVQLSYGFTPATKHSFRDMLPHGLHNIYAYAGLSFRLGK